MDEDRRTNSDNEEKGIGGSGGSSPTIQLSDIAEGAQAVFEADPEIPVWPLQYYSFLEDLHNAAGNTWTTTALADPEMPVRPSTYYSLVEELHNAAGNALATSALVDEGIEGEGEISSSTQLSDIFAQTYEQAVLTEEEGRAGTEGASPSMQSSDILAHAITVLEDSDIFNELFGETDHQFVDSDIFNKVFGETDDQFMEVNVPNEVSAEDFEEIARLPADRGTSPSVKPSDTLAPAALQLGFWQADTRPEEEAHSNSISVNPALEAENEELVVQTLNDAVVSQNGNALPQAGLSTTAPVVANHQPNATGAPLSTSTGRRDRDYFDELFGESVDHFTEVNVPNEVSAENLEPEQEGHSNRITTVNTTLEAENVEMVEQTTNEAVTTQHLNALPQAGLSTTAPVVTNVKPSATGAPPSTSAAQRTNRFCESCGSAGDNFSFHECALLCPSCLQAYLREKPSDACREGGTCPLTPGGSACRACFFRKCRDIGMGPRGTDVTASCWVCSDDSPRCRLGWHYTAFTCARCVTFFTNCDKRQSYRRWRCEYNSDCLITKEKDNCKLCHYKKCQNVGMYRK